MCDALFEIKGENYGFWVCEIENSEIVIGCIMKVLVEFKSPFGWEIKNKIKIALYIFEKHFFGVRIEHIFVHMAYLTGDWLSRWTSVSHVQVSSKQRDRIHLYDECVITVKMSYQQVTS